MGILGPWVKIGSQILLPTLKAHNEVERTSDFRLWLNLEPPTAGSGSI